MMEKIELKDKRKTTWKGNLLKSGNNMNKYEKFN